MRVVAHCPKCDAGLPVSAAEAPRVDQVRPVRPGAAARVQRGASQRRTCRHLSGVPRRRFLHPQGLRSEGRPHGRHHRRADQRGLLLVRRRSRLPTASWRAPRSSICSSTDVWATSPSAIDATASSAASTSARRHTSISTRPTCSNRSTSEKSAAVSEGARAYRRITDLRLTLETPFSRGKAGMRSAPPRWRLIHVEQRRSEGQG